MKKLLTVAIPTYNGGSSLSDAVKSCRNIDIQASELEVLVVDNCSIDNSIELLKEIYSNCTSLRIVINSTNIGRIQNWNRCLELAEGEYLLFLFTNDLINIENYVKESLDFFSKYPESALLSVPWIISDFKMNNMFVAPQYFRRTPGIGTYVAEKHIKKVAESGKLPFVCLQSNFLRMKIIKDSKLLFDSNFPITSDGIFLSELAMHTNFISFFHQSSIIWRQDAPNRLHSNIKFADHIEQFYKTFTIMNNHICKDKINISRAFANYKGYKYSFISLLKAKTKADFLNSYKQFKIWFTFLKSIESKKALFYLLTIHNIFISIFKFPAYISGMIANMKESKH